MSCQSSDTIGRPTRITGPRSHCQPTRSPPHARCGIEGRDSSYSDVTAHGSRDCLVDVEKGHVALLGVKDLVVVRRTESGFQRRVVTPVRFVPMTGKAEDPR